jgi:hypothetical protein
MPWYLASLLNKGFFFTAIKDQNYQCKENNGINFMIIAS